MTQLIILWNLLFLIITIFVTGSISLQTQKGVIVGRQTQYSVEYLG